MANSVSRTLILDEAARRGLHTQTVGPNGYLLKITHPDGRSTMLRGSRPAETSVVGYTIALQKNLTMDFAQLFGFTTPASRLVTSEAQALALLEQYKKIVIKPADGERTLGVTVDITSPDQIATAFKNALENSKSLAVIAQQHLEGNLYRILVINGVFAAAVLRAPATVIGDGVHTVQALIEQANLDPRRAADVAFKKIDPDAARAYVGEERFLSIPAIDESIIVAEIISMGTGGESITVTDIVHEDWRNACELLASEAGLYICGYDIICPDISKPREGNYLPMIEMNSAPSLGLHELASSGEPTRVTRILLNSLFPITS